MPTDTMTIKDNTANPAPLGLLAFGISGLIFYLLAGKLSTRPLRTVIKTVQRQ